MPANPELAWHCRSRVTCIHTPACAPAARGNARRRQISVPRQAGKNGRHRPKPGNEVHVPATIRGWLNPSCTLARVPSRQKMHDPEHGRRSNDKHRNEHEQLQASIAVLPLRGARWAATTSSVRDDAQSMETARAAISSTGRLRGTAAPVTSLSEARRTAARSLRPSVS